VYNGFRRIISRAFRTGEGRSLTYEIKLEPDVCVVLAISKQRVILVRQFRPGPERMLDELPGGRVEANETPLQAAERELKEETGFSGDVRLVGQLFHCAYSTRRVFVFVALDCRRVTLPSESPDEQCAVVEIDLSEFRERLRRGELTEVGPGYLALESYYGFAHSRDAV
jgi:ADP-ribose pyrophosphatase